MNLRSNNQTISNPTNKQGEIKMSSTTTKKALATLASVTTAAAALLAFAGPASADSSDPQWLGELQVTPTSGHVDEDALTGWITRGYTNDGQVCPDGFRERSGVYPVENGDVLSAAAGVFRNGSTYSGNMTGINDGDTRIDRNAQYIATSTVAFPWVTFARTGGSVELRVTCQAAASYAPATDFYYSALFEFQAGGDWEVVTQGGGDPTPFDTSESDINVNVPDNDIVPNPTGLKISVKPGPATLAGGARTAGEVWQASGTLDNVTVNDDRRDADEPGWTLNGKSSNFTSTATSDTIAATNLGWTPNKVSGAGAAGAAVTPGAGGGLSTNKPLATGAASNAMNVTTTVNAGLTLNVPADVDQGAYKATLTLTLI
jgi:hypothetical protein